MWGRGTAWGDEIEDLQQPPPSREGRSSAPAVLLPPRHPPTGPVARSDCGARSGGRERCAARSSRRGGVRRWYWRAEGPLFIVLADMNGMWMPMNAFDPSLLLPKLNVK